MDKRCIGCKNYYEDNFCSYTSSWCIVYGCIDCNPDNILLTFNGSCPMYNKNIVFKSKNDLKNLEPFINF